MNFRRCMLRHSNGESRRHCNSPATDSWAPRLAAVGRRLELELASFFRNRQFDLVFCLPESGDLKCSFGLFRLRTARARLQCEGQFPAQRLIGVIGEHDIEAASGARLEFGSPED